MEECFTNSKYAKIFQRKKFDVETLKLQSYTNSKKSHTHEYAENFDLMHDPENYITSNPSEKFGKISSLSKYQYSSDLKANGSMNSLASEVNKCKKNSKKANDYNSSSANPLFSSFEIIHDKNQEIIRNKFLEYVTSHLNTKNLSETHQNEDFSMKTKTLSADKLSTSLPLRRSPSMSMTNHDKTTAKIHLLLKSIHRHDINKQPGQIDKKNDLINNIKPSKSDEMFEFWFSQPHSINDSIHSKTYPRKITKSVRNEEPRRNYLRKKYAKKSLINDEKIKKETERIKSLKNKYFQTRIKKLKDKIGPSVNESLLKQLLINDFDPKKYDTEFENILVNNFHNAFSTTLNRNKQLSNTKCNSLELRQEFRYSNVSKRGKTLSVWEILIIPDKNLNDKTFSK